MKRRIAALVVLTLLVCLAFGTLYAGKGGKKPPKPGPGPCPNKNIFCLDVYDPVVCDDGKTYSNQCYADRACATGCESTGGGPTPL